MFFVVGRRSLAKAAFHWRSLINFSSGTKQGEVLEGRAPLGDNQFAAALFLERHGLIESHDSALRLIVCRRLSGYSLQPKTRRGHKGEQRTAMLGREADDLVGEACNHRQ